MFSAFILCFFTALAPLPGQTAYLNGHAAEEAGDYGKAIAAWQACQKESALLAPYAQVHLGRCLCRQKQYETALQCLKGVDKEYKDGPWRAMALAALAELYVDQEAWEKAAPLYNRLLAIDPHPWWMQDYAWRAAICWIKVDAWREQGFAWFRAEVENTLWSARRRDAARELIASPSLADRRIATLGLLRSASYSEAAKAIKNYAPPLMLESGEALEDPEALLLDKALLEGRHKQQLDSLIAANKQHAWWPLWLIYSMRTQAGNKRFKEAAYLCDALIALDATAREAGEALWWLAEYGVGEDQADEALKVYDRLATLCPTHYRADDARYYAGNLLWENQQEEAALEAFRQLGKAFPDSRFHAEALYRCGQRYAGAGQDKEARLCYTQAASQGFGKFYAHRAQERLFHEVPLEKAGLPNLKIDGENTILRTFKQARLEDRLIDPSSRNAQAAADFMKRLRFFGLYGLEAGEWEALHVLRAAASLPDPGLWYIVVADCGFAHTAQQFADAKGWGYDKQNHPQPERLRLLYPRPYWEIFQEYAKATGLDPYLLLALARQESTFRASVRSSAGATGVMQIMPSTAKWMVKVEPNITTAHIANLKDPHNSIRLGAYYLMRMVDSRDGHLVYALASYNAGPGNCNKWRKRWPNLDIDAFIERIPFSETQGYVRKVLGNYAAYRSLYPAS